MPKLSAGLLVYRLAQSGAQVLLVHPGGPYWVNRDSGAWSVPKGEHTAEEDPLAVALREFREELGVDLPPGGPPVLLGEARQRSGKRVTVYALEGDLAASAARSNTFTMEWPPGSGVTRDFPEVDRAAWFSLEAAREKLVSGQVVFIDRLSALLHGDPGVT